jgi:hypothetical protein
VEKLKWSTQSTEEIEHETSVVEKPEEMLNWCQGRMGILEEYING